ncbi:MAG TPA: efflux transporter outer membrane subunit [Sphingomonas sp.]|uniref:efflux transporter outer membrane subunit n=1 Tax=Sphingomonas sp. TaxID=28214 RepID=UPI002C63DBF0|nr:efflux transporter outer membrane subunit [Sphingomonas sp.]HMI19571.1 efflux transporter outer membrane subunit [Sphingomonas sp.]
MKRRVALFLVLATGGCVGPRPAPPSAASVTPPAAWQTALPATASIEANWWQGFHDPVLTRVVAAALANNSDVAIAAARVSEARAQFHLAHAQLLPTAGLAVGGDRERFLNAFGVGTYQTAGEAELSASYDLDLFGRLSNASAAARASLLSTQAAYAAVRLAVATSAASGYITLRALDARLIILRETLTARENSVHITRRRAETGYSSELERQQAEAEYQATLQLIPVAELAIKRQEDGLSLLLGENPRAIERGAALDTLMPLPVPATLPAALLRGRPDIAQAEQQMIAADHSLDAARAAFMPDVRLSAAGGYVASTLIPDPVRIFSLGGSILAPLFEGGALRAQADAAAARRDQAAFGYRRTALAAFRDVEDALAAIQRSAEQEKALAGQRDALAIALRLATNRYLAGYASYLDKLDAQRGLLAAELQLVQAHADTLNAQVALYQSLGGGWSSDTLAAGKE